MIIAVVSDTHRDKNSIKRVAEAAKEADLLMHLGDNVGDAEDLEELFKGKVISVRGNCDFMTRAPLEMVKEIEGVKILITHGHKYDVKNSLSQLIYRAEELDVDIALYGHTHVSEINFEGGMWLINPGSASLPREGEKSIAFIELKDGEIDASIQNI